MDFQFHMPTKVIIGKDCIQKNKNQLALLGRKALIVTGSNSAKANGSLADVVSALTSENREYAIYDKVMPNPNIACAYEGAATAKAEQADFVIAIGGGSPMDAGKAIALLACQDIQPKELFSGEYEDKVLPLALVPTTAGTGSEVTQYSILTNEAAQTKMSISSPLLFPRLAFLDAKYTLDLPIHTTINTAVDALSHAVEGMLSKRANSLTNTLAQEAIRLIAECFDSLKAAKPKYEEREKLLYAAMLAGMVIAHTGTTAVHSMGYSLTFFKDIDHGRANGLLLSAFLEFSAREHEALVKDILAPMGYTQVSEFKEIMDDLLGDREAVTDEEIEKFASIAVKANNRLNSVAVPDKQNIIKFYRESLN